MSFQEFFIRSMEIIGNNKTKHSIAFYEVSIPSPLLLPCPNFIHFPCFQQGMDFEEVSLGYTEIHQTEPNFSA